MSIKIKINLSKDYSDDLFVYPVKLYLNFMFYLPGQYPTRYQEQMSHWPEQVVNIITKWLTGHNPSLVVADFGCGESLLNSFSIANYCKENLLNI